ncbi:hypothetical protein SAMN04487914_12442 [Arthrobacter sp. ok909]|uniref:hypothetical protein n=1 Tax=Arthrobacter sp. ok909 TaxID=1761746 RepID=UPI000886D879|nr:hypothetical protein [Arthrobacter sp. ok909]SDP66224.1 hypothetical protein SAMN04487914_12442 [Arthrobacter sp. ok909]
MIGYDTTVRVEFRPAVELAGKARIRRESPATRQVSGDPAVIHIAVIHIATAEPPGRVDGT